MKRPHITKCQTTGKIISFSVLLLYLLCVIIVRCLPTLFTKQDIWITFLTLGYAMVNFFIGALPLALTALTIPVVLAASGVLSVEEAFRPISNSTILTFGGMFIVGGALFHTGLAERISRCLLRLAVGKRSYVCFMVMMLTAAMSSVLSNTGTAAVLVPIVCAICDSAGWRRKDLLYPMAVLCSTGGMITLVGTPPNLACNGFIVETGLAPIGFFEFAAFGIPMTVVSIVYFLFLEKFLSNDGIPSENLEKLFAKEVTSLNRSQILSGLILTAVIIVMIAGVMPIELAAVGGALLCIFLGVLSPKEAYESLDLSVLFLFAGALALSIALESSGAGELLSQYIVNLFEGRLTHRFLVTVLFFVTNFLTHFMSNTACFALMAPIGLKISEGIGISPYPIMITIALAASAAFATPVATPPNTMILGPSNMSFREFLILGLPLCLAAYLISILIVPVFWPF